MNAMSFTTLDGAKATVDAAALEALSARIRGTVLRDGDDAYEDARGIWNSMIDRRPALIVCCVGASDVVAAVNFARENKLLVSVRGGGHNIAGSAVCDGGLMIDLSLMKSVRVDVAARRAWVGPGATLVDV
ncbi:MAG: FAD-dependent oxidoreductase, partial [Mesorhizobium sp.]